MSGIHSIIPPSSAGIFGKTDGCTGWVEMAQRYPEIEESEDAAIGEASHEIGAGLIHDATTGPTIRTADQFIDTVASNGVVITEEMYDGARIYADDVIKVMQKTATFGGPNFGIEKRVICKAIHELSFGTLDMFIFDRKTFDLYIWDYKFGHEIHEAFENWQMINYLSGLAEELDINGLVDQIVTVHVRIVQPRALHRDGIIREWTVKLSDLRSYWNILSVNAHTALGPNAKCRTGNHCKHCTARCNCDASLRAGSQLFEIVMKPTPVDITPEALGIQYALIERAYDQVKCLKSGYETQVKHLIRTGKSVPGWLLEMGKGKETWEKPIQEVIQLGKVLNIDLKKPDEAVTPNQARKMGIPDTVVSEYSTVPKRGLKVVKDDGSKLRKYFGDK